MLSDVEMGWKPFGMPLTYGEWDDLVTWYVQKKISIALDNKEENNYADNLHSQRFFRAMVDENPQDAAAKSLMVDALKVAQASKNNVVKILNLIVKMEELNPEAKTKASKGAGNSVFNELDNLLNE